MKKKKLKTKLKSVAIKKNMGWCDDIRSNKFYNKIIKLRIFPFKVALYPTPDNSKILS